ncbi:HAD family hydrolase [Pseudonocardia sp. CA-142604]|uniref:HAD family hydrolase n=1 Tax=Pseudonocardia sp. CA-142604 TaxID=3240024 RepID=UPI003D92395E
MDRIGPPSAVVFDIGGVLGGSADGIFAFATELGVEATSFAAAYWRHRDSYDLGSAAEDYWNRVADDLGRVLTAAQVRRLDVADAQRWSELSPGAADLIDAIARTGVQLALLSNAPRSMAEQVRSSRWGARFPTKLFSCDMGLAKPDPGAYATVEDALGLPAAELVFFDDRPVNVLAAQQSGWSAFRWQGPQQCLTDLASAGVAVPGA